MLNEADVALRERLAPAVTLLNDAANRERIEP